MASAGKGSHPTPAPGVERRFPVSPEVEGRFSAGLTAGLDPDASDQQEPLTRDQPRQITTTIRSRWLHRLCPVCGHTFRPGDGVRVTSGEEVVHDMPGLRCAPLVAEVRVDGSLPEVAVDGGTSDGGTNDGGSSQAFFEGLAAAWPMPDDVAVVRLEGSHPLLAPPRGDIPRRSCRVCGHSFRPMDHVVLCPFSDSCEARGGCRVAVHRDLLRQLHCWDEWVQGNLRDQCLGFS